MAACATLKLAMGDHFTLADRKLLIGLEKDLSQLAGSLRELKDDLKSAGKVSKSEYDKLDTRIRNLENFKWWLGGGTVTVGIVVHFILEYWTPK
jgi:hypothetical protein